MAIETVWHQLSGPGSSGTDSLVYESPPFAEYRAPATEAQLDEAERLLKVKLPDSLRVIYRIHNGQELSCDASFPETMPDNSMFHGLLGGYVFRRQFPGVTEGL